MQLCNADDPRKRSRSKSANTSDGVLVDTSIFSLDEDVDGFFVDTNTFFMNPTGVKRKHLECAGFTITVQEEMD